MPDRVAERLRSAAEGIRSAKYAISDYSVAMETRILNESDDSQKNRDGA